MSFRLECEFSREEQRALLALARSVIVAALAGQAVKAPDPQPACLQLRRGVFVTIHVDGNLRGCIGLIEGRDTLLESIIHCAESAAFRDARFSSLRPNDLAGLQIEISVLSELFPIDPDEIEIGKHGLFISAAHRHGLLLPQVAVEHNLSREEFLEETCRKAGLPREAWRRTETELLGFTCEIFQDDASAAAGAEGS
jgi:AmmeMemoRadiSam system protein A